MHHPVILLAAAWLFATGFVYQCGDDEGLIIAVFSAVSAPVIFPFAAGKAIARFLTK